MTRYPHSSLPSVGRIYAWQKPETHSKLISFVLIQIHFRYYFCKAAMMPALSYRSPRTRLRALKTISFKVAPVISKRKLKAR